MSKDNKVTVKAKSATMVYFECTKCGKQKDLDCFLGSEIPSDMKDGAYSETHNCCGIKHTVEY